MTRSRSLLPAPSRSHALVLAACAAASLLVAAGPAIAQEEDADPPEVAIGERLFLETRFAEYFARSASDVNEPLAQGDPVVDEIETPDGSLPGPFAGASMNCRSCHFVDESLDGEGHGMRTYADFASHSPVPAREDGAVATARNSPSLVGSAVRDPDGILHLDGEFSTAASLVAGTFTGRNFGWLPGERARAVAHIARVLREDDGSGDLAAEFGGAYRDVLAGTVPAFPLPPAFRVDVDSAGDEQLLQAVSRLVAAYVDQLAFAQDEDGTFVGSPYDRFLELNHLPRRPRGRESGEAYARRLKRRLQRLKHPRFVDEEPFAFHPEQAFAFGPRELQGLKVFLARPARSHGRGGRQPRVGIGNCSSCHAPPSFSDSSFHNTGVSQVEYDGLHGSGAFQALFVPSLRERARAPESFLPATEQHPRAQGPYRRAASAAAPGYTDLGLWNVFANPDFPEPQAKLWRILCSEALEDARPAGRRRVVWKRFFDRCGSDRLLDSSLARFKTPGLRDLGHSLPLMHNGRFDSLRAVLEFYRDVSEQARRGSLRNGDPELAAIRLGDADIDALEAFLLSLNEDYE